VISVLAKPLVHLCIKQRIKKGLEIKERITERFGIPSKQRPNGHLFWFHAVSVGEVTAVTPFIQELHRINPELIILLTTMTVTAAELVEQRLSDLVIHQFIPFDVFMWMRRFIKYWKPSKVFLVESELWPNMLYYLHKKDIPIFLLNARLSKKSQYRMHIARKYFNILPYSLFNKIFAPSRELKEILTALGAKEVIVTPNIKIIAHRLPTDANEQKKLKARINDRKTWLAVSTHKNEEEILINIHKKVREYVPSILTVMALRHPNRANEVKELCESNDLSVTLYTDKPNDQEIITDIYILNKIGCLGDFFATIDTVLVCGSLVPGIGGHNFIEPINFSCNTATGQYIDNFRDVYPDLTKLCKKLETEDEIVTFVTESLNLYKRPKNLKSGNYTEKWLSIIKQLSIV
jgi:3-deoxy-D-manno-octulosonic-acid transferase